ncbi:hypothetical protein DMUE_1793 [Dictyocoela muelleri]|nr:hypothetical protein DMUE_1793 [Dictyocoela muelleri]
MRAPLSEKTNAESKKMDLQKKEISDKHEVLNYLKDKSNTTKDYNLKYDLTKCIEIIEGKENQEFSELKDALEDVMVENEKLFKERAELIYENDLLKGKLNFKN